MNTRPGACRQGGVAIGIAALLLVLSGLFVSAAGAKPGEPHKPAKQADTTPNDHPSGRDRTHEAGGGTGTQGQSTSDPDGMSNGGADKPGGDGGFDADKDGNNGCGNDDDFEDDNNGNCGGRRAHGETTSRTTETTTDGATTESTTTETTTERTTTDSTTTTTPETTETLGETAVLGVSFERQGPAAAVSGVSGVSAAIGGTGELPVTGAWTIELLAIAMALISLGALLVTGSQREEALLA
jgi:hypothetical protein